MSLPGASKSTEEPYILNRGGDGAERLRLIARVNWPRTRALLLRAGLRRGMRCLDVGCGIGEVTRQIRRIVGPQGSVTGVDNDAAFLATARQESDRRRLGIRFVQASALEFCEEGCYELVYARFLLTHVPDRPRVLSLLRRCLAPGGVLVVEDIDFPGHFCHPPNAAFDRYLELYQVVARANGSHPTLGPWLPELLREAGFTDIHCDVVQPVFMEGEGKRIAAVTLAQIGPAVVRAGLASAEEVNACVDELERFAADPKSLISLPRIFQVWGRRPATGCPLGGGA